MRRLVVSTCPTGFRYRKNRVVGAPPSAEAYGDKVNENSSDCGTRCPRALMLVDVLAPAMMEDIMVALVHARFGSDARGIEGSLTILDLVRRLAAAIAREVRVRRDLATLQAFDDSMLHDIGLSRGEIEPVVRNGRPLAWTERR